MRYTDPTGHYLDEGCGSGERSTLPDDPVGDEPPFDNTLGGNNEDEETKTKEGDDLTSAQLTGKVVTNVLVEVVLVIPTELSLFVMSLAVLGTGPLGVVSELILVTTEIVVLDFGLSLALNAAESVETGKSVDFKWTILPALITFLPGPTQDFLHDVLPRIFQ
jgi:hypothetical protein